jgi:hypothetical protein
MTGGINGGKNLKIGNQESCREAVSCILPEPEISEFLKSIKIRFVYH